jgi:hypothetical protein
MTQNRSLTNFLDTVVMLLGSGEKQPLEFRKKDRDELVEKGFKKIIIMEESTDKEYEDISLDDKLRRIIQEFDPDLYVAFFHKDTRMDGVAFELGWLCCKFSTTGMDEKVRIFFDQAFDWSGTTSYIPSLFVRVQGAPFDESKPHHKASINVEKSILEIFGRRLSRDFSL